MAIPVGDGDLEDDEIHDINVTPFIDVILVLLIIFMVAAPLSTVDLPVDLPSSSGIAQKPPLKPVYVTIKADLSIFVADAPVQRDELAAVLDKDGDEEKDRRIFLRADKTVPYGELMKVLELLRQAGFLKIALVAREAPPAASDKSPRSGAP